MAALRGRRAYVVVTLLLALTLLAWVLRAPVHAPVLIAPPRRASPDDDATLARRAECAARRELAAAIRACSSGAIVVSGACGVGDVGAADGDGSRPMDALALATLLRYARAAFGCASPPGARAHAARRSLVIQVAHGLSNRLRAYASARALADATGRLLLVVWPLDEHCNASFSELFEAPRRATVRLVPAGSGAHAADGARGVAAADGADTDELVLDAIEPGAFRAPGFAVYNYMEVAGGPATARKYALIRDRTDGWAGHMHVYVRSAYLLVSESADDREAGARARLAGALARLRPVAPVSRMLDGLRARLRAAPNASCISAHIRMVADQEADVPGVRADADAERGLGAMLDAVEHRRRCRWESFVPAMARACAGAGAARACTFVLAADDAEGARALADSLARGSGGAALQRSPLLSVQPQGVAPRECAAGSPARRGAACLRVALAEQLALAQCGLLLASDWSSFSEVVPLWAAGRTVDVASGCAPAAAPAAGARAAGARAAGAGGKGGRHAGSRGARAGRKGPRAARANVTVPGALLGSERAAAELAAARARRDALAEALGSQGQARPQCTPVSLVAACKGRHEALARTLPSWMRVRCAREVVLVDWGSEPPLRDTAARAIAAVGRSDGARACVLLVRAPREARWALSRAYNLGLRLARAPVVAKVDCDTLATPALVDAHLAALLGPERRGGRSFLAGDWRLSADENEAHLNGVFVAPASAVRAVGGYDERLDAYGWDDSDLYERLETAAAVRRLPLLEGVARHLPHSDVARVENQLLPRAAPSAEHRGGARRGQGRVPAEPRAEQPAGDGAARAPPALSTDAAQAWTRVSIQANRALLAEVDSWHDFCASAAPLRARPEAEVAAAEGQERALVGGAERCPWRADAPTEPARACGTEYAASGWRAVAPADGAAGPARADGAALPPPPLFFELEVVATNTTPTLTQLLGAEHVHRVRTRIASERERLLERLQRRAGGAQPRHQRPRLAELEQRARERARAHAAASHA